MIDDFKIKDLSGITAKVYTMTKAEDRNENAPHKKICVLLKIIKREKQLLNHFKNWVTADESEGSKKGKELESVKD